MLENKWILPLALFAVVSVVLVGTVFAEDPLADPEAAPGSVGAPECLQEPLVCTDSQHLVCKPEASKIPCPPDRICMPQPREDYWACVGPEEIGQETCAHFECKEDFVCRLLNGPDGKFPACVKFNPGQKPV